MKLKWTDSAMGFFRSDRGYRFRLVNVVSGDNDEDAHFLLEKLASESGRSSVETLRRLADLLHHRSDGGGPILTESPFADDEFEVVVADGAGIFVLSFELADGRFARLTEVLDDEGKSL